MSGYANMAAPALLVAFVGFVITVQIVMASDLDMVSSSLSEKMEPAKAEAIKSAHQTTITPKLDQIKLATKTPSSSITSKPVLGDNVSQSNRISKRDLSEVSSKKVAVGASKLDNSDMEKRKSKLNTVLEQRSSVTSNKSNSDLDKKSPDDLTEAAGHKKKKYVIVKKKKKPKKKKKKVKVIKVHMKKKKPKKKKYKKVKVIKMKKKKKHHHHHHHHG